MAVTKNLVYYDTATITDVKSFIVKAPEPSVTKLFTAVIYKYS